METYKVRDYEVVPGSKTVDDLYFCIECKRVYLEKVNCSCCNGNQNVKSGGTTNE